MRLQENEEVLHELRPSARLVGFWALGGALGALLAGGAVFLIFVLAFDDGPAGVALGLGCGAMAAMLVFGLAVLYAAMLRHSYVYTITNQRLLFRGGILWRRERSVPYHKVTDVEQSQIIFERMFGLWRLKIYTPGTGQMAPEIQYLGLVDVETPAATINDVLRSYRATGE